MPQSLANVVLHIIYSTKNRAPYLKDRARCGELYAYMATVLHDEVDSPTICIDGFEDHVHVLCRLSRKIAIMDVIKTSKTETSKWLKKQGSNLKDFQWQAGYGVFSVSQSNVEGVIKYIEGQERRHQKMTFQDEFREICRQHGIVIDERYVWD